MIFPAAGTNLTGGIPFVHRDKIFPPILQLVFQHLKEDSISIIQYCSGKLSDTQKAEFSNDYDEIISLGEKEYAGNPPSKYYPEGKNLHKRMKAYKDSHLYFMYHENIDYTNNLSERSLRSYKRKQKQAVSFRSRKSQEFFCDSLSIIKTAQLRNESIYKTAKNAFDFARE